MGGALCWQPARSDAARPRGAQSSPPCARGRRFRLRGWLCLPRPVAAAGQFPLGGCRYPWQRPPAGSHLLHMAAGALAGPRLPDGRRVRARHDVPEHAPPQRKDTRRSGRAVDPAGTPPHANHPCQVQIAGKKMPPASRCCRTASRRRGTASQSARPSPLRARAGCGCRGSTVQTRFGSRPPLSSRACGMPSRDDAGTSRPTRTRFCCRARSRDSSRRARRRCRRNGPRTSVTWRARRRLGLLPYPKILTLTLTR